MALAFHALAEHKANTGSAACAITASSFCSLERPDRMDAIYARTMIVIDDEWL
jgi:hypothetical protein